MKLNRLVEIVCTAGIVTGCDKIEKRPATLTLYSGGVAVRSWTNVTEFVEVSNNKATIRTGNVGSKVIVNGTWVFEP